MDFTIFEAYNFLQDIILVTDPESFEVLWVNKACKQRFGDYSNKKCYEYLYNKNSHCFSCELKNNGNCNENNKIIFTDKKSFVTIDDKKYMIVTLYDANSITIELNNNMLSKSLYEMMLSGITNVDLHESIQEQVYKILFLLQNVFDSSRVSIVKNDDEDGIFPISVKRDEVIKDFYYNPVLKGIIYNDVKYKDSFHNNRYVEILYSDILDSYPDVASILAKENIDNITLMSLDIDDSTYFLVIENSQITISDKTTYTVIYNYLVFLLKSFLYNKKLYQMSNKDVLTNVSNRYKYQNDIEEIAKTKPDNVGVLFLDLDRLKKINDTFGHHIGDKLIVTTSKILTECFDFGEVYRLGGDEFVTVVKGYSRTTFETAVANMKAKMDESKILCSYGLNFKEENGLIYNMIIEAENQMYYYKRKHHEKYHENSNKFDYVFER